MVRPFTRTKRECKAYLSNMCAGKTIAGLEPSDMDKTYNHKDLVVSIDNSSKNTACMPLPGYACCKYSIHSPYWSDAGRYMVGVFEQPIGTLDYSNQSSPACIFTQTSIPQFSWICT